MSMTIFNGIEVCDFGPQGMALNTLLRDSATRYYNWNKYLKVKGGENEISNLSDFINDRDPRNQYTINRQSLFELHVKLYQYYIDSNWFLQNSSETGTTHTGNTQLDIPMWKARMTEMVNLFGEETELEFPVGEDANGRPGFYQATDYLYMTGANNSDPELINIWRFLQSMLIPTVSCIYMMKTGDFQFSLRFYLRGESPTPNIWQYEDSYPRNWLWYGAPGTGKSHDLQGHANLIVEREEGDVEADIFRYSFSPATTYGDFVGEYRPKMVYSPPEQEYLDSAGVVLDPPRPGTPSVDYAFVPGIFLRALIRANQIQTPVILVIDEINRGDIYEILGEVFQLMERNDQHQGSYSTSLSHEAMNYLRLNEFNFEGENDESEIKLPPNFYLWGTMNPNDASVQQIDSAFFRRWVTKYIGIDYSDDNNRGNHLLPNDGPLNGWEWGEFRTILNQRLMATDCDEEELIGMWFLKTAELDNWEKFYSKLVFHLANNVLKMRLTENNGIFTENTVRGIMSMCKRGENPFDPEHFPSRRDVEGGDDEGEGVENGLVEDENIEAINVEGEDDEVEGVEGENIEAMNVDGGDD